MQSLILDPRFGCHAYLLKHCLLVSAVGYLRGLPWQKKVHDYRTSADYRRDINLHLCSQPSNGVYGHVHRFFGDSLAVLDKHALCH
jgi:hypothetical protein